MLIITNPRTIINHHKLGHRIYHLCVKNHRNTCGLRHRREWPNFTCACSRRRPRAAVSRVRSGGGVAISTEQLAYTGHVPIYRYRSDLVIPEPHLVAVCGPLLSCPDLLPTALVREGHLVLPRGLVMHTPKIGSLNFLGPGRPPRSPCPRAGPECCKSIFTSSNTRW
jgi:hypothetical protein